MIVTLVLVLVLQCVGSVMVNVTLSRAEQSSNRSDRYAADKAFDNNLDNQAITDYQSKQWLKIYFDKPYTVKGLSFSSSYIYQVSVYNGVKETVCGNKFQDGYIPTHSL